MTYRDRAVFAGLGDGPGTARRLVLRVEPGGHTAAHEAFVQFLRFGVTGTDQHRLPLVHLGDGIDDPSFLAAVVMGQRSASSSRMFGLFGGIRWTPSWWELP